MKKLMKKIVYLGAALALSNCANPNYSDNAVNNVYKETKNLTNIVWDADTLIKNTDKSIYETILADSVINKEMGNPGDYRRIQRAIEMETLDLRLKRAQCYNKFLETRTKEDALNTIAYSQYIAARFPGNDENQLEVSARVIDDVSKRLRK